MIPKQVDLPTIWRGCDWPAITLRWKDANGNPLDLSGWTPFCQTVTGLTLNPQVVGSPLDGVTTLSLTKTDTSGFKLGEVAWDWIWWSNQPTGIKYPPFLTGKLPVKDPYTEVFT